MRPFFLVLLLLTIGWGPTRVMGQQKKAKSIAGLDIKSAMLVRNSMDYHQALVRRDYKLIKLRTSNYLSYGHSNGWIESQADQLRNLETGYLIYHSYKEDSMMISYRYDDLSDYAFDSSQSKIFPQLQLDFIATIDVSLQGKRNTYRLRVTEVWSPIPGGGKGYQLICRKATKL